MQRSQPSPPRRHAIALVIQLALALPFTVGCSTRATEGTPIVGDASTSSPPSCDQPLPRYGGTICGTPASPCAVQREEIVVENYHELGTQASFTLDATGSPVGAYRTRDGNDWYVVRRRGADDWTQEHIVASFTTATLAFSGSSAHLYGRVGPDRQQIQRHTSSDWKVAAELSGEAIGGWPRGVVGDRTGCLHVAAELPPLTPNGDDQTFYGLYRPGQGFSFTALTFGHGDGPIALSPSGTPHLTYWGRTDPQMKTSLIWTTPTDGPEVVVEGTNRILVNRLDMAVTGATTDRLGTPHIFCQRGFPASANELVLASREASGGWQLRPIITSPPAQPCSQPPTATGQTCRTEYRVHSAFAVIPGETLGGLRLLYGRERQVIEHVGACDGAACSWTTSSSAITGALLLASVGSAGVEHTTIVDTIIPSAAAAQVDAQGRIHLLVVGAPSGSQRLATTLYYLRLGPTP